MSRNEDVKREPGTDEPEQKECPKGKFIDPVSLMENGKFVFKVPPEAPVFEPTPEEFKDPLKYIAKIRSKAQEFGICKIKPPENWYSPFSLDIDHLKFTTNIQKLNELDASTRVKLHFVESLTCFWQLFSNDFKIPVLEQRSLDCCSLYNIVESEGGHIEVSLKQKWSEVACRMGFIDEASSSKLKAYYEKWLYPFVHVLNTVNNVTSNQPVKIENNMHYKQESCRSNSNVDSKMAGCGSSFRIENILSKSTKRNCEPIVDKHYCQICGNGESEDIKLICSVCNLSFHVKCLTMPLTPILNGKWRCHNCIISKLTKPRVAFVFEQSHHAYTLEQFQQKANIFKQMYFQMPVHLVPSEKIEQEYWKNVSLVNSTVTVEHGADLHTMMHGSGFPTAFGRCRNEINSFYRSYIEDGWNLNNLSRLKDSFFSYANSHKMKVPRMYVGMCFSTFCWHTEDHWSYSINFLHWGEPKTWYGVPGSAADTFEEVMKETASELFNSEPNLLHQRATTLNPNILMKANVPVFRTDQHAKEFIVTFPRAYHAGFNQGFNFAEAVNFTTADWLSFGREYVENYQFFKQMCMFSHEELVCNFISSRDDFTPETAEFLFNDLMKIMNFEKVQRKAILDWGVTNADFVQFEHYENNQRQCIMCYTTIYVSAVSCLCKKFACLRHFKQLCKDCQPQLHVLKYRYTLDELLSFLKKVSAKLNLA